MHECMVLPSIPALVSPLSSLYIRRMAGRHDALFKSVFEQPEHAAALIYPHLSEALRTGIDWSTMTLLPGSFVDEDLRHRHCDLVFRVASFSGPLLVYVLLEHQSSSDPLMTLRIFVYLGRLWARWAKEHPGERLPLIVPLVVSNAPDGWHAPVRFSELFPLELLGGTETRHLPDFEILVDDLCRTSDDELASRAMANAAKLALWLLSNGRFEHRLRATMHRWAGLFEGLPFASLSTLMRYFASVTNDPEIWQEFRANLRAAAPSAEGDAMSLYDQWIAQGRAEGHAEGHAAGRAEGEATLLTRLLTTKFGPLSESIRTRLATASIAELEAWADRVLFASSIDQVFSP